MAVLLGPIALLYYPNWLPWVSTFLTPVVEQPKPIYYNKAPTVHKHFRQVLGASQVS